MKKKVDRSRDENYLQENSNFVSDFIQISIIHYRLHDVSFIVFVLFGSCFKS